MESLKRLGELEPFDLPDFRLDPFQEEILSHLYLEFFLARCRALVTPRTTFIATGEVEPRETEELTAFLAGHRPQVAGWRRYVVVNLALYTALLETSSYYLTLNDHLLICRFVAISGRLDEYQLKLYTIAPRDLPARYNDKIYLGRDLVSMRTLRREHFGLPDMRLSVEEQLGKLEVRLLSMVPGAESEVFRREYLDDLHETASELGARVDDLVRAFPGHLFGHGDDIAALLEASSRYREVKHLLIEMEDSLGEMERTLLAEGHPHGARYVTRLRRDVQNYINFIMCKINGRISNVVNRVDALAHFQTRVGVGA